MAGLAARSRNNGSGEELLVAVMIGPAGGQIEITEGQYSGLRLSVPSGALAPAVDPQLRRRRLRT